MTTETDIQAPSLETIMLDMGVRARRASAVAATQPAEARTAALEAMAQASAVAAGITAAPLPAPASGTLA